MGAAPEWLGQSPWSSNFQSGRVIVVMLYDYNRKASVLLLRWVGCRAPHPLAVLELPFSFLNLFLPWKYSSFKSLASALRRPRIIRPLPYSMRIAKVCSIPAWSLSKNWLDGRSPNGWEPCLPLIRCRFNTMWSAHRQFRMSDEKGRTVHKTLSTWQSLLLPTCLVLGDFTPERW